jgi:hypothetical protein
MFRSFSTVLAALVGLGVAWPCAAVEENLQLPTSPFGVFNDRPLIGSGGTAGPAGSSARIVAEVPAPFRPIMAFPLGVFEDVGMLGAKAENFKVMIDICQARGLDSVWFNGGSAPRDADMFAASDAAGFDVYFLSAYQFPKGMFNYQLPVPMMDAKFMAKAVVGRLKDHPSLKGYVLPNSSGQGFKGHLATLARAFHDLDPIRPVFSVLYGVDDAGPVFEAARPDVFAINVYPCGGGNEVGDFTLTGFGRYDMDFVQYVRAVTKNKPADVPLWFILQAHKSGEPGQSYALREPTPAEVRLQNWLAVGEGAKGIFWFIYSSSSQYGWRGLRDNPPLFAEVGKLAKRVGPLRPLLMDLRKSADFVKAEGEKAPYAGTLISPSGKHTCAVVANTDCKNPRKITISCPTPGAQFKDLETGEMIPTGTAVPFLAGDGKIFEVIFPPGM